MGGQKYTIEQLEKLRESPLVQKPDGLPSIEQWMDVPVDQNSTNNNSNRRPRSGNHGEGTTAGERGERPLLISAGSMGHFGRRPSQRESKPGEALVRSINALFSEPEDTVLGPPKLAFTSASRTAKAAENSEKRGITSIDGDHLGDRFPTRQRGERWTRDRDSEGNRDKAGYTNGRRAARDDGEGWTNVKGRKSLGQEEFDRGFGRNGDRDREKSNKDGDADVDGPVRRGGAARWGRRDEASVKEGDGGRFGGSGQGGWRERERDRERDRDRDWNRGGNKVEEDPEWMDTRITKEKKQAHTQEEFQRWKEQMRAKDAPAVEKEELKADTPTTAESSVPTAGSANASSKPLTTPSAVEPSSGIFFGNWNKDKGADPAVMASETLTSKPKLPQKSRFMKMFEKPEEPTASPAVHTPASPGLLQPNINGGADADKEGFQRILQMLGGTNISANPASQQAIAAPINGTRQGGISLDHNPQSPHDEPESRPPRQPVPRTIEQQNMLENILAPRPSGPESRASQARFNTLSPDNALLEQLGLPPPRSDSNRPGDEFPIQQPPPRNTSAQDAHLHALLNSRARESASQDPSQKQRDFLLNLMQQPRATPPQVPNPNAPRPGPENQNLPFFDQGAQRPQPQSKGRGGPPPGFMEDPRFVNEEMMRREQQLREANLREHLSRQQQEEAMRAKNARIPMGFNPAHDDPAVASLQRRNTAGEIPRQMTNMGIPSQPVPEMQMFGGRNPPGMPPTPHDRPNIPPPPGFGAPGGMRQPPGLGGPNGPQGPPSFSAGNTPLGHPPGFGPPPGAMQRMFPGGPGGQSQMPPQGPPQGYFPPPGYGPPMGMRGEDPRMMMGRPEFEQFGAPGPRQAGRPPNMY